MKTQAVNDQQNTSNAIANNLPAQKIVAESNLELEKNQSVMPIKTMQEVADNSAQVEKMNSYQTMASNSPHSKQAAQLQAMANMRSAPTKQNQDIQSETTSTDPVIQGVFVHKGNEFKTQEELDKNPEALIEFKKHEKLYELDALITMFASDKKYEISKNGFKEITSAAASSTGNSAKSANLESEKQSKNSGKQVFTMDKLGLGTSSNKPQTVTGGNQPLRWNIIPDALKHGYGEEKIKELIKQTRLSTVPIDVNQQIDVEVIQNKQWYIKYVVRQDESGNKEVYCWHAGPGLG